ncbi:MAG: ribonuclease E/G [Lachnospiraceae bacterium]|nr:ribonuclease E/G [Lachnospiraceae bacterium]
MASDGKILILKLHDRRLSLLLRGNQILSASVWHDAAIAVGNIYIGKVQNISRNINAAFIDLGSKNLTFLPMNDAVSAFVLNRKPDGSLKVGDDVLVQVDRAPMKTKLAGVTTKLSLPGQYTVVGIWPKGQKGGVQVSAKLDAKRQAHFRESEALLRISERFRLIVRTNAGTLEREETLLEEARTLSDTLAHILEIASSRTCYSCLYRHKGDCVSFVENAYRSEYDEVITDLPEVYDNLLETCRRADIPLRLYKDSLLPLYKLYSVEQRLQELTDKKVWLKSGGYLVIEPTEALISIDVNTGKYEAGKDQEETFYRINREAAEMIAVHLRARNLSGMILIDFINLKSRERKTELLEYMRTLLKRDPIPARALDMTALGLMELTRKKVSPSLAEQLR